MRAVLLVLVPVILAAAVPASAQSLAELAAKEAARRATIKEPARVVTDKDLPHDGTTGTKAASVRTGDGKAATSAARSGARARTDDNGHDERWWNARAEALVQKLNGATRRLEAARARAEAISADMKRSGSGARTTMTRRLERAKGEVDRWAGEVADAGRALQDLEEEARKAGALPGWLRR